MAFCTNPSEIASYSAQSEFSSKTTTDKMQPTDTLDNHKLLCVDITGIDLSKDEPAMLSLVERLPTALRTMRKSLRSIRKGKAEATDNSQQTPSSDSRKLVHIDVTDIDFADDESKLVDTLFRRLGTALVFMAKQEAMASQELSLKNNTQSLECPVYLEAEESSKDIDNGNSANSLPILGTFSGPWRDAQHFLGSWQDDLDTYEGDSEIYDRNDADNEFDEDTSAAIKTFKDSNPEPGKTYEACHRFRNGKVMKFAAMLVRRAPIPEPMQAEICHVDTDDRP